MRFQCIKNSNPSCTWNSSTFPGENLSADSDETFDSTNWPVLPWSPYTTKTNWSVGGCGGCLHFLLRCGFETSSVISVSTLPSSSYLPVCVNTFHEPAKYGEKLGKKIIENLRHCKCLIESRLPKEKTSIPKINHILQGYCTYTIIKRAAIWGGIRY